ncbi:MAG: DUF2891 family protein [Pseudonocardiaceae bacterium]|nr:DUF2891 family protein [Pseudonocardiaceae bacterium]
MTTTLDDTGANRLLSTAIANLRRDYPVHWTHIIDGPEQLRPQRAVHPVFAGSYDWHSCVHQTWLIVRMLRLRPDLPEAARAREALDELLTESGCTTEAEFFAGPHGMRWERPYGWAWLLMLDAELRAASASNATNAASVSSVAWAGPIAVLARVVRRRWLEWISGARLPVRTGTHGNTAFAAGLVLDAARGNGDTELAEACSSAAVRWYGTDVDYGGFEPDAADFLSPSLVEADLMRRVLDRAEFGDWFQAFLPDAAAPRWTGLREPVSVDDPSDPHGSHLSGLVLSRAWCWREIGFALPDQHPHWELAAEAARAHTEASWRTVFGNGYAAEHWVGTFAAYLHLGALHG